MGSFMGGIWLSVMRWEEPDYRIILSEDLGETKRGGRG